jgi:hypothetical protein
VIYIFESDGAGGRGVSDLFKKAYGDDAFACFYCPYPAPPYLETSRIGYLRNHFGAAKGLAANICIDAKLFSEAFSGAETAIVLRNPIAASIRSYQAFLTTYAVSYWPDRTSAPAEFATLGAYIDNIRGSNYLIRALAGVPTDEAVNQGHFVSAKASLANFDHFVIAEDLRLSLLGLMRHHPSVRTLFGNDQHAVLQSIDHHLGFDAMHVSPENMEDALAHNALDMKLYAEALTLATARYVMGDSSHAV